MSDQLKNSDEGARRAGTSTLEILRFALGDDLRAGHRAGFGINAFGVREVAVAPFITKAPNMPVGVEKLISPRAQVVPVMSGAKAMGLRSAGLVPGASMIETEHRKRTPGLLTSEVDRIVRVDFDMARAPQHVAHGAHDFITALREGTRVSIRDVETILSNAIGETVTRAISPAGRRVRPQRTETVHEDLLRDDEHAGCGLSAERAGG